MEQQADVDLQRAVRCGFPEVIYAEGKSPELVVQVMRQQMLAGQQSLATRVTVVQAAAVKSAFPDVIYNPLARTLRRPHGQSKRESASAEQQLPCGPVGLRGPYVFIWCYLPGADEGGFAYPHETRLLIKVY